MFAPIENVNCGLVF